MPGSGFSVVGESTQLLAVAVGPPDSGGASIQNVAQQTRAGRAAYWLHMALVLAATVGGRFCALRLIAHYYATDNLQVRAKSNS